MYQYDGQPDVDLRLWNVAAKMGVNINEYVGGEIRLGKGIRTAKAEYVGFDVESSLDYIAGAYIKVGGGQGIRPYAMIGYNKLSMSVEASNNSVTLAERARDEDIAYGIGVDLALNEKAFVTFECASLYTDDRESVTGCSAGLSFNLK